MSSRPALVSLADAYGWSAEISADEVLRELLVVASYTA